MLPAVMSQEQEIVTRPKTSDRELEEAVRTVTEQNEAGPCSPDTTTISAQGQSRSAPENVQEFSNCLSSGDADVHKSVGTINQMGQTETIPANFLMQLPTQSIPTGDNISMSFSTLQPQGDGNYLSIQPVIPIEPHFQSNGIDNVKKPGRQRRPPVRKRYPEYIVVELESYFQDENYPTREQYQNIANAMRLDISRVKVWFQNRRSRERRHAKRQLEAAGEKQSKPNTTSSRNASGAPAAKRCKREWPLASATSSYPAASAASHLSKIDSNQNYIGFNVKSSTATGIAFQPQKALCPVGSNAIVNPHQTPQTFDSSVLSSSTPRFRSPLAPISCATPANPPANVPNDSGNLPSSAIAPSATPSPYYHHLPAASADMKASSENTRVPYAATEPAQWHRMTVASAQELGFEHIVDNLASTQPFLLPYEALMHMYGLDGNQAAKMGGEEIEKENNKSSINRGLVYTENNIVQNQNISNYISPRFSNPHGQSYATFNNPNPNNVASYPYATSNAFNYQRMPVSNNHNIGVGQLNTSPVPLNLAIPRNVQCPNNDIANADVLQKAQDLSKLDTMEKIAGSVLRQFILSSQQANQQLQAKSNVDEIPPLVNRNARPESATTPLATKTLADIYGKVISDVDANNNQTIQSLPSINHPFLQCTQQPQGAFKQFASIPEIRQHVPYPAKAMSCPPYLFPGSLGTPALQSQFQQQQMPWASLSRPNSFSACESPFQDSGYTSLLANTLQGSNNSLLTSAAKPKQHAFTQASISEPLPPPPPLTLCNVSQGCYSLPSCSIPFTTVYTVPSYAGTSLTTQSPYPVPKLPAFDILGKSCASVAPTATSTATQFADITPPVYSTTPWQTQGEVENTLPHVSARKCKEETEEAISEGEAEEEEEEEVGESSGIEEISEDSQAMPSHQSDISAMRAAWNTKEAMPQVAEQQPESPLNNLDTVAVTLPSFPSDLPRLFQQHYISSRISPILPLSSGGRPSYSSSVAASPNRDYSGPLLTSTPEHESSLLKEQDDLLAANFASVSNVVCNLTAPGGEFERCNQGSQPMTDIPIYSQDPTDTVTQVEKMVWNCDQSENGAAALEKNSDRNWTDIMQANSPLLPYPDTENKARNYNYWGGSYFGSDGWTNPTATSAENYSVLEPTWNSDAVQAQQQIPARSQPSCTYVPPSGALDADTYDLQQQECAAAAYGQGACVEAKEEPVEAEDEEQDGYNTSARLIIEEREPGASLLSEPESTDSQDTFDSDSADEGSMEKENEEGSDSGMDEEDAIK